MRTLRDIFYVVKGLKKVQGPQNEIAGAYQAPHPKIKTYYVQIIIGTGMGWEHVSITLREYGKSGFVQRCPTWGEMCMVKDWFWNEDEVVMQLHPAKADHVSVHDFCLHLWKPTNEEIPTPPKIMVG